MGVAGLVMLQTRTGVTVNGHPMLWVQRCCRARNGIYAEAHFVDIENPRGAVFLMLVMVGTRRKDTGSLEAEFAAVVRTVRPSPADHVLDFAAMSGDAGLEGAWITLATRLRPNTSGGIDLFADKRSHAVRPRRHFRPRRSARQAGAGCFLRREAARMRLLSLAHGSIVVEKVANDHGMLEREERPLTCSATELGIGTQRWRPVVPLAVGSRLDGSWRHLFASAGQGAFSSGGVTVKRVLTLTPNGRFTRTGFAGFSGSNEAGGAHERHHR